MDAARKAWNEDRMARLKQALMDWSRTTVEWRVRYAEMTPHEVLFSVSPDMVALALAELAEWEQRGWR